MKKVKLLNEEKLKDFNDKSILESYLLRANLIAVCSFVIAALSSLFGINVYSIFGGIIIAFCLIFDLVMIYQTFMLLMLERKYQLLKKKYYLSLLILPCVIIGLLFEILAATLDKINVVDQWNSTVDLVTLPYFLFIFIPLWLIYAFIYSHLVDSPIKKQLETLKNGRSAKENLLGKNTIIIDKFSILLNENNLNKRENKLSIYYLGKASFIFPLLTLLVVTLTSFIGYGLDNIIGRAIFAIYSSLDIGFLLYLIDFIYEANKVKAFSNVFVPVLLSLPFLILLLVFEVLSIYSVDFVSSENHISFIIEIKNINYYLIAFLPLYICYFALFYRYVSGSLLRYFKWEDLNYSYKDFSL